MAEIWGQKIIRRVECARCGDEFFTDDREATLCPACTEVEKSDRRWAELVEVLA